VARVRLTIDETLTLLRATPERLAGLAAGLTPAQLRAAPRDGEWSANDVLAHLRACADARGECIPVILAEDHPTLRAVDPRTWIEKTDYRDLEFGPSLRAFATQRAELLALLEPLPPAGWSRAATVTGAGKPLERTVMLYAEWMARHEQPHLVQVQRIVRAIA
jgi:hypothetical protein